MPAASRKDGRRDNQLRAIACELGLLSRADGSARYTQGPADAEASAESSAHPLSTSMLCAVYGPGDVKVSRQILDRATVDVDLRVLVGLHGFQDTALELQIRRTVDTAILSALHPHTSISIVLQVEQVGGALCAAAINAACLALADAGLPMSGLVAGACVALVPGPEGTDLRSILDPTLDEEAVARCVLNFAFSSSCDGPVLASSSGPCTEDEFFECCSLARKAAKATFGLMRLSFERKLAREFKL